MTVDPDLSCVVSHDRLDDRQAEAGAMLLCRVVGREQAAAFVLAEALAAIGDVDADDAAVPPRDDAEFATVRHRVDRVQQQVLHDTAQLVGVATEAASTIETNSSSDLAGVVWNLVAIVRFVI